MSRTVFLARHARHDEVGSVLSGRSEIALNATGESEASRLAARLATVPLGAIYSSPRRRARQTAATVAERHTLPIIVADGLDEIDFGQWSGQTFAALANDPAWKQWNTARGSAATPAGETMAAIVSRAVTAITETASDAPVLCVSHCDVIRGVVAHYLGLDTDRMLTFDIDPASLTTLVFDHNDTRVGAVNERVW